MSTWLTIHLISIAMSFGLATYTLYSPSISRLRISYAFYSVIVASGVALTIASPGSLLKSCLFGLVTLSILLGMTSLTRQRLSA